jgi:uncharacterized membrane protein YphA (DoxX/SURF4 family)
MRRQPEAYAISFGTVLRAIVAVLFVVSGLSGLSSESASERDATAVHSGRGDLCVGYRLFWLERLD